MSTAEADPITVTAAGATFAAENDRVILSPTTFTLAGDPFVGPVTFDVQPGHLLVDFSPSQSPPYPLTLSRLITIDGVSSTVTQDGSLSITPTLDTLTIFRSSATQFDFGPRGTLLLTLDGASRSTMFIGDFPFTIAGTLSTVAPTPEPMPFVLLALGLLAVARRSRLGTQSMGR